jgi:FkbM family methyltransferase
MIEKPELCDVYLRFSRGQYTSRWGMQVQRRLDRRRLQTMLSATPPKFGEFEVRCVEGPRRVTFDPRNTQFESVYAPQYRNGYEIETAALLDVLIPQDGVFFDIGANWGHFSVGTAVRPGFVGRIHAFEPNPRSFADLSAVINQLDLGGRVFCHPHALSDRNGSGTISLPNGFQSGLATVGLRGAGWPISLRTLDSLELEAPDVLKIDVEGHEANVLRGAAKVIASAAPMLILESWLDFAKPEVTIEPLKILSQAGYELFQSAVRMEVAGGPVLHPAGTHVGTSGEVELHLVRFSAEERFLRGTHFNVFGCHRDRRCELEAKFSWSTVI